MPETDDLFFALLSAACALWAFVLFRAAEMIATLIDELDRGGPRP